MPKTIDVALFGILEKRLPEVKRSIELGERDDEMRSHYEEYLRCTRIAVEATMTFMNSFFIQFFSNGYGLEIDAVSPDAKPLVNSVADSPSLPRPEQMIASFNEFYALENDLSSDGYGGHGSASLKAVVYSTLPAMLTAFASDGRGVIANHDEVMKAAAPVLAFIAK